MSGSYMVWAVFAPLLAAGTAVLLLRVVEVRPGRPRAKFITGYAALFCACMGLLAEVALLGMAGASADLPALGITLAPAPLARAGAAAVTAALLCVLLMGPAVRDESEHNASKPHIEAIIVSVSVTACLLVAALLVTSRAMSALLLFAAAVVVAVQTAPAARTNAEAQPIEGDARRMASALKQTALSVVAAALLVAGALFLARYPFNLERTGLLQAGLGLLSVGLMVRVGALPFSGGTSDLIAPGPRSAVALMGAVVPASLFAGMLWIAPLAPLFGGATAAGLGAVGALLAGVRSLAAASARRPAGESTFALLLGSSAALQAAWALFGALDGSRAGTTGAALLALNMALALPLGIVAGKMRAPIPIGLTACSLLGLPLLGGFPGALLVAEAATNRGGLWPALLLTGCALTAAGWLGALRAGTLHEGEPDMEQLSGWKSRYARGLVATLVTAQFALLLLSPTIAAAL